MTTQEAAEAAAERLTRSVESLKAIYAVIIGLAIEDAIEEVSKASAEHPVVTLCAKICVLISFLSIAVPFFHGMNRHLDLNYIETTEHNKRFLLFDFLAFLTEACFLFLFAKNLCDPTLKGFYFLGMMIGIDMLWGIMHRVSHGHAHTKREKDLNTWIKLDIGALLAGGTFFSLYNIYAPSFTISAVILCVMCVARTIIDFKLLWPFYFPGVQEMAEQAAEKNKQAVKPGT